MHIADVLLGWPEIIMLLVIVLVLWGAKAVPELLGGMRRGLREFMKATREVQDDVASVFETEPTEEDEDRQAGPRYGFKFWLIVALGVAAMWGLALALRELVQAVS